MRELNQGHVAELFLSVVCYSNGSDTALDDDVVFVILAVSNMHEDVGPLPVLCGQRAALHDLCYKSMTMSPSRCEQQISTLPSAGASTGSGR